MSQPLQALQEANRVRLAQIQIRKQIKNRERTVAEILLEPPAEVAKMPIFKLLAAQPRWGEAKIDVFCQMARISGYREIGRMCEDQRRRLARMLTEERRWNDYF